MNPEDLLKMLRDGGLDDETMKHLLEESLHMLEGPEAEKDERDEYEDEKETAGKLLGVTL